MNKKINITIGEGGYKLRTPVQAGQMLYYHGSQYDPFAIPEVIAKRMADDAKCKYVEKVATPSSGAAKSAEK